MLTRLTKLLGSLVVWLLDQLKIMMQRSFGKTTPGTCVVLYYHAVPQEQRARFAGQMERLVRCCKPVSTSKLGELKAGVHHAAVTFDDGFRSALQNALPELQIRNIPATIFVSPALLGQSPSWTGVEEIFKAREMMLDLQEMKQAREHGLVSIGSHCRTHPDLLRLEEREARDEIFGSKLQLESMLDEEIQSLSFPFGSFGEAHVKMAREAGYGRVFTTSPELFAGVNSGKYVVGRVKADPEDWPLEFRLKVLGAYRWLPLAFSVKRKLRSFFAVGSNTASQREAAH